MTKSDLQTSDLTNLRSTDAMAYSPVAVEICLVPVVELGRDFLKSK